MNLRRKDEHRKRELMAYMLEHRDLPQNLSDEDRYILKRCNDAGYVENLKIATMASGKVVIDAQTPEITDKGRSFLFPKKDYKFVISSAIAIAELAVIIVQALVC